MWGWGGFPKTSIILEGGREPPRVIIEDIPLYLLYKVRSNHHGNRNPNCGFLAHMVFFTYTVQQFLSAGNSMIYCLRTNNDLISFLFKFHICFVRYRSLLIFGYLTAPLTSACLRAISFSICQFSVGITFFLQLKSSYQLDDVDVFVETDVT